MSRKRDAGAHKAFTMIRIDCPRGHPIGKVVRQFDRYLIEGPFTQDEHERGIKLQATCRRCSEARLNSSYQVSWQRLADLLDSRAGVTRLTIGGNPVH